MSIEHSASEVSRRRCVVTGAAGFIGSHLSDALLAAGHEVVGIDCFTDYYPRSVKERNIAPALAHPSFRLAEADLRDADLVPILEGADVVFHLAAMAGLLKSWVGFDGYQSCNLGGTFRLIDALREVGSPHLVHVSTSSVYGVDSSGDETRPKGPISPYGVTKLAAENLVTAYGHAFDLPYTILRYFSIYGPRQRPDMGYHIFIERILAGEPITIFGDGEQTRGNTFVHDCVEATIAAMEHGPSGEAYNIGGGEVVSANEVVRHIERITGREAIIEFGPKRPGEQRKALADTSKAQAAFGWHPRTGIDAGLRAQIEWHLQRHAAPQPS
jgi:nucleoside-diphosphate-sugar epimerase